MLQQFTWQQFLIAALVLSLIWYAAVILLFYRKKLNEALKKKKISSGPRVQSSYDPRKEAEDYGPPDEADDDLIGKPALPDGVFDVPMDMVSFAPKSETDGEDPYTDRDIRLGLIPDVLEEIKTVFSILQREGGTKEDFISLFNLISAKYPQIRGTPNEQALNDYIRENLPFTLTEEELRQLWK